VAEYFVRRGRTLLDSVSRCRTLVTVLGRVEVIKMMMAASLCSGWAPCCTFRRGSRRVMQACRETVRRKWVSRRLSELSGRARGGSRGGSPDALTILASPLACSARRQGSACGLFGYSLCAVQDVWSSLVVSRDASVWLCCSWQPILGGAGVIASVVADDSAQRHEAAFVTARLVPFSRAG
jgi:hypothetical protein